MGRGEVGLTYVGHATLLIELGGLRLLTDPVFGGIAHVRRQVPAPTIDDLRDLDAVLISHAHRDHLDHRSLRLLGDACPVIVPRGTRIEGRRERRRQVIELDEGDRVSIGTVALEAVHAAHDGRRHPFARPATSLGYLLHGTPRIYFAGDTGLFSGMAALAGRVDVALLPIWGWGPRLPAGHLDPIGAGEAVARIQPKIAVPIHWGTLRAAGAQRGLDPVSPARQFSEAVARIAPTTEVRILMPGEQTAL